jgi:F420-non-reducing hydrogenase large subunit
MKQIKIDPITRLEGHGKIDIFLNDEGEVENTYFQIPELRGFEQFCIGRPVEELPRITTRICGVCPEAHHMASVKACDAVFHVTPPPTAKKLRQLLYNVFFAGDHTTHFYALGGPDFIVGPTAPAAERNILGVIKKVGLEVGGKVIEMRKRTQQVLKILGGKLGALVLGKINEKKGEASSISESLYRSTSLSSWSPLRHKPHLSRSARLGAFF